LLLKSDPPSRNDGDRGKSHGVGFPVLILKGEVEDDGIGSVIIVPGEKDFFCFRQGNLQTDLFAALPFRNREAKLFFLNP